jgi:hypothetical protein
MSDLKVFVDVGMIYILSSVARAVFTRNRAGSWIDVTGKERRCD